MPTQPTHKFELNLFDTTRTGQLTALLLLGIFGLLGLSIWAAVQLGWPVGVALFGGGAYLGWRAYKRAAIVPTVVTITPTELRLEDLRPEPRLSQALRLADITTYRYSNYNNAEELRLNRADAPPLKLRGTGAIATVGDFGGMLAAFEQAMGEAPGPTGAAGVPGVAGATRRERSFFEKPISTYLLVVFTLVIVALVVAIFASGGAIRGNGIGSIGAYIAYVVAWRAAAARRNAA